MSVSDSFQLYTVYNFFNTENGLWDWCSFFGPGPVMVRDGHPKISSILRKLTYNVITDIKSTRIHKT